MSTQSNLPPWGHEVQPAGGERHLPVYLLADTSSSMEGAPIQAVRMGLEQFQREVSDDSFARESVRFGLITFGSDARLLTDGLVPISDFQLPPLVAAGVTRLDLAFERLRESMDRDVTKPIKGQQKGDWKPIVFVLTDGHPTDEEGNETDRLWKPVREALINRSRGEVKPGGIVGVGFGSNVDEATLKGIAHPATLTVRTDGSEAALEEVLGDIFQQLIWPRWNPGVLNPTVRKVNSSSDLLLPPPPEGWIVVP